MTNTRENAKRNEEGNEEQEVPFLSLPQAIPQAPIDRIGEHMSNAEVRSAFQMFFQALMAQAQVVTT